MSASCVRHLICRNTFCSTTIAKQTFFVHFIFVSSTYPFMYVCVIFQRKNKVTQTSSIAQSPLLAVAGQLCLMSVRTFMYVITSCPPSPILLRTTMHRDSRSFVGRFYVCMVVFVLVMIVSLLGYAGMCVHTITVGLVIEAPPLSIRT